MGIRALVGKDGFHFVFFFIIYASGGGDENEGPYGSVEQ